MVTAAADDDDAEAAADSAADAAADGVAAEGAAPDGAAADAAGDAAADGAVEAPPLEQAPNTMAAVAKRIAGPRRSFIGLASFVVAGGVHQRGPFRGGRRLRPVAQ